MVTNINISNALGAASATVDANFVTQDNAIFATGLATGAATINLGTTPLVIDSFASGGSIAYDTANNHVQIADGSYLTFAQSNIGTNVALVSQGNTGGTLDLNGAGISFTPDVGDGSLGISVARNGATLNLSLNGTGTINFGGMSNPVITIPKDFSLNFAANSYSGIPFAGTIHGDGVNDVYATLVNGTQLLLTGNGAIGGNLNFAGVYGINNITLSGSVLLDPLNLGLTLAQGSTLGADLGTRHVNFTATDNAGGQLSFGANGLTFTTAGGDGGLILSVTENGKTRRATLDVVGTITYSLDGSITLGAGTVVRNIFEEGNILTITANTDASGSMIFDPNGGLYITPSTPDALNVALTTDGLNVVNISSITGTINYSGVTRQALLDVVGNVTYNRLDGSITLGAGTVVRNIFADGNILTITSNTDAGGSMIFDPNSGLYITPSTPDALNVVLTTDGLNVVNISSITGTINYIVGLFTISDGAQAHLSVYDIWESELRTTGGTASLQFTADRTVYTANEGATLVGDWLDGKTWELQGGTLSDNYSGLGILSAGSTFRSNDSEFPLILETAGNYNINGVNVITTADYVQVQLANYDTVIVGDLAYTPLNENAAIAISDAGVIAANDQVSITPISLFMSADLADDFLPNYETDFATALQIVDAASFDNGLSEILPAETLGEINFGTQTNELSQNPQIVIAPEK